MKAWPPADVWAEFTVFHEGAWDSTSCVFARDGAAVPLPEKYTPEAYKEWGQVMHEWQGEVASVVQPDGTLRQTLRRWWPTVGCEFGKKDLAETRTSHLFASSGPCKGVAADGSYCDAPDMLPATSTPAAPLVIEHCIPTTGPGARIRLVVSLHRDSLDTDAWVLGRLELFNERHVTRSVPGEDATDGWVAQQRLDVTALEGGVWEACGGATLQLVAAAPGVGGASGGQSRRVVPAPWWSMDPKPQWSIASRCASLAPGAGTLVLLPLNCWLYVEQAAAHMLVVESGQLAADGSSRLVVACGYLNGRLDNILLGTDASLSADEALAKGYIQSKDAGEQAFYEELLEELQLNTPGDQQLRQASRTGGGATPIDK